MGTVQAEGIRKAGKSSELSQFDRVRHIVGAIGGPLCALLVYFASIPSLDPTQHTLLAIMTLVCLWWITEPVPIPVTSLLGPVLCVVCGVVGVTDAFKSFASPIIFLFMGGFILAGAMVKYGLDKRFAYRILSLKIVSSSPTRIFLALGVAAMICSGWISNTATAAMMLPIALGLLETMRDMESADGKKVDLDNSKFATGLMLMTAYSCSIGGVLTPIGTPPNLIMIGFLDSMAGIQVSFFEWMSWGAIAMLAYFVIAAIVLHFQYPANVKRIEGASEMIEQKRSELGPMGKGAHVTMFAFATAVVLWVLPGILSIAFGSDSAITTTYNAILPESVVALIAALILFVVPVDYKRHQGAITWSDATHSIDWGTLILFGGGLSMGTMLYSTGLSSWIGDGVLAMLGGSPSEPVFIAVFCVLSLLMSELTSHTAATNMIGPLAITTAISAGMNPIPVSVGVALSASLGFMLPVSTPPNAIVYATGHVPITKMIKSGFIIDVVGIACVTIPLCIFFVRAVVGA
jgi:sodium-dependent dicarboxylate transporter 2/3/5